ncbi:Uncharacterized protein TCM_034221 [Theobroma cacao]|uniref:Uncharacterized protein n=1 Tax=Theobroma cacao TaxID=3641 RepID=A0A061FE69_THECC|nr:Uncharacterized protein TCM_034221 [Theobroma cacao]
MGLAELMERKKTGDYLIGLALSRRWMTTDSNSILSSSAWLTPTQSHACPRAKTLVIKKKERRQREHGGNEQWPNVTRKLTKFDEISIQASSKNN